MKLERGINMPGGGGKRKEKMSPGEQRKKALELMKKRAEEQRRKPIEADDLETISERPDQAIDESLKDLEVAKMGDERPEEMGGEDAGVEPEIAMVDSTSPDFVLEDSLEVYNEVLDRTLEKMAARANQGNKGLEITADEMREVLGASVKGSVYSAEQGTRAINAWKKKKNVTSFDGEYLEKMANGSTNSYWKKPEFQAALKKKVDEKLNPDKTIMY